MKKSSKGILGLFLALCVLSSGVCVGADTGDILDFLPAFVIRGKFGNAVAKPFFIVPGVSTPVTITAYIPDANLVQGSVQLKDGPTIIGNLTDTGNKVFSITNNFQRDSGGAIKLSISATFGTLNKTIAQFEIKVLSLPSIQNATQYNQNVDNIFATLVAARDNFRVLKDPSTPSAQFFTHLSTAKDRLLSVYANMEAIYHAETHSPSNFARWAGEAIGLGGLVQSAQDTQNEMDNLRKDPTNPMWDAGIIAWANSVGYGDYLTLSRSEQLSLIDAYQIGGHSPNFNKTLQEADKVAIKETGGQYTGLAGGALGEIYVGGFTGQLIGKGINDAVVGKTVDIFITNGNQMGMQVSQVQNGEALQVPTGSHDVLYSFGGVLDRAIERNIPVSANTTSTVNIAPGETKLCKYLYQDLGDLGGGTANAYSINNSGHVVGYSTVSTGEQHAFLWTPNEGMRDLNATGWNSSGAIAINDNDQIIGSYNPYTYPFAHGFLWTPTGGMQDFADGIPCAINNSGQIAGNNGGHAFLKSPGMPSEDLGTLNGLNDSSSRGINNLGQVVGDSWGSGTSRSFLKIPYGIMQDIGALAADSHSVATAINDNGQIVGWSGGHAFLKNYGEEMQDLGVGSASAINNLGQVVGGYSPSASGAFLWTASEGMLGLNNLVINLPDGVVLVEGEAINDKGQIAGYSNTPNRAFLLTPIP